jgi:hypothetical protein
LANTDPETGAAALPHLAHDRLLSAMRVVETLPPPARGALLVGSQEDPIGTILIDANRVCWGAAPGMSGRLRDILRSHCSQPDELDAIYSRCKRESVPLVEALGLAGLVSPEQMRAALKQHTIESLLAVDAVVASQSHGALEWPMHWIGHSGLGYEPRHTFGPVELVAAAGAQRLDEEEAERMTDHLENLAEPGSALVAFSFRPDGTPLFVGASTQLPIDLADLIDLTSWADAALGASPGFSPAVAHACLRAADGGVVAWKYEGQCCAAICLEGASLLRLTTNLRNQSLAMVLATRIAALDRVRERSHRLKEGD